MGLPARGFEGSLILAAVKYARESKDSPTLIIVWIGLNTIFYMYLWSFFVLKFEVVLFREEGARTRWKAWVWVLFHAMLSFAILGVIQYLVNAVVEAIARRPA